jgi:hypothetical protein
MTRTWIVALALAGALLQTASAQDAKTVIGTASKAMGVEGLNSIHYYGVAQNGNLGQNNNANQPWPLTNADDYVRTIDFTQPASRATWMTYAVAVTGGVATQAPGQQNITPQNTAWAQQLEIWITPWGFQRDGEGRDGRRQALPGGVVQHNREIAGRRAVSHGRLHQWPESGRESPDLAGESDLWRHAGGGGV